MAANLTLSVQFKIDPVVRFLDKMVRSQIPYARAVALTRLAQEAQTELQSKLEARFILRGPWVKRSVRIIRAEKKDPTPRSEVGTAEKYMELHATGGIKKAPSGKKTVTIPQAIRIDKRKKIPRSKWPGKLSKKKGRTAPFFFRFPGGPSALVQRKGKGDKAPFKVLYIFKPTVKIKKRWPFEDTVEDIVRSRWDIVARRALEQAVRNARPPK